MKHEHEKYNEEIEINKRDCVSTSKEQREPRPGLCASCKVAAARARTDHSEAAESGQEAVEADDSPFDELEQTANLDEAFLKTAHLFGIEDSNGSSKLTSPSTQVKRKSF